MKSIFVLPVVVAALALTFFASGAVGSPPADPSRGCADIEGGVGFTWDGTNFTGSITLFSPACRSVNYTLYILNNAGGTLLKSVEGVPFSGNATTVQFTTTVQDTDSEVCVYATSSSSGHVFDVGAPTGEPCAVVDNTGSNSGGTLFH
jgi:hypothetical protein